MRVAEMDLNLVNCVGEVEKKTPNYFKRISVSYIFVLQMLLGYAGRIVIPYEGLTQIPSSEIHTGFLYPFENCQIRADFIDHNVIFCLGKERKSVIIQFHRDLLKCKIPTEYQFNFVPDVNIESQPLQLSDCRLFGFRNISATFDVTDLKILDIKNSTLGNESLSLHDYIFFGKIASIESVRFNNISKPISENLNKNLPNLKNLTLVQNNIRDLGYFFENNEELRVLNFSNSHLKSLPGGVFKKLSNLQQLCLNTNELSLIRDNYFMGLSQLKSLDLSTNFISHIEENAFSDLTDIIEITLKSNQLKKISSNIFRNNRQLENINLDSNPQMIVPDYAFANLRSLKTIKMSNSELENVFEHTFENCSHLINLELQNNKFVQLPSDLLQTLNKLKTLNLGNNKLQIIPDKFLSTLENLEYLNLEGNQLSIINNITFVQSSLNKLKVLNLRRNRIVHIHKDALSKLFNLVTFDLSYNHWEGYIIPVSGCSLEQLNVSHNSISSFALPNILWQFTNLRQLDFSHNFLNEISVSLVSSNRSSVTLNLGKNNISHITFIEVVPVIRNGRFPLLIDLFDNPLICDCEICKRFESTSDYDKLLESSIDLRMDDSQCLDSRNSKYIPHEEISLKQFTYDVYQDCPDECTCSRRPYDEIFIVDCSKGNLFIPPVLSINEPRLEIILTKNSLTSGPTEEFNPQLIVPDYVFANLRHLTSIKMSNSELENVFDHTFENCSNLINLELQNNKFVQLPPGLLQNLKKLTTLNLGNNKLQFIPDTFFSTLENLKELNLEDNQFSIINNITFVQSSLNKLKVLNLRRNRIVHIHQDAFQELFNLVTFDLSNNHFGEKPDFYFVSYRLEQLNYSHNSISSFNTSNMFYYRNLKQLDLSYNTLNDISVSLNASLSNRVILNLSHNNISHVSFIDVMPKLNSFIRNNRFPKTMRVDIFDNTLICDCRNYEFFKYFKGTTDIDMLLKRLINIRMNGTQCLDPKKSEYIPFEDVSLQQLTCEDNHDCPAECTCSWRTYDETFVVDCSYRNLVISPTLSINKQRLEIILIGNSLRRGPTEDMGYENVTILNLSSNKLISFDWCPPYIERLNLSHNILKMLNPGVLNTLNTSSNFSQLILEQNPWVCDCSALELQKFIQTHLQKVDSNDVLCEDDQTALYKKNDLCKSKFLIVSTLTLIPILTILLLIISVIAFYLRYEREIKIWLYSKNWCLWIVSEEELDKDEMYDIFLSFSHKDEDFVIENLLPSLDKSFKLCIHSRDWVPGELINHQIVFSVYNSRRTVVVLSNDFLESAWGKLEFVMAHQRSMEDRRPRVIVIKLSALNMDKMDDDFKAYMKTNTYVEWGDPWFWKKLMYSLPHSVIKNADLPSEVIPDFQYDGPLRQARTTTLR